MTIAQNLKFLKLSLSDAKADLKDARAAYGAKSPWLPAYQERVDALEKEIAKLS